MARDDMTGDLFGGDEPRRRMAIEKQASDRETVTAKRATRRKRGVAPTSRDAYAKSNAKTPPTRVRCLAIIPMVHPGMTADEAAAVLGVSILSTRPAFTNMKNDGEIIQLVIDGKVLTRKTALNGNQEVFVRLNP